MNDVRELVWSVKRNILLNPGPATTTDSVKMAQVVPDICPREKEFCHLMQDTRAKLLQASNGGDTHDVVLIPGSGTAMIDSVLNSVLGEEDKILILINGSYGRRMRDICNTYYNARRVIEYNVSDESIHDEAEIRSILNKHPDISHVAVVHHETTTGLLNPIENIQEICEENNCDLIVDAMSSFAGIPIDLQSHRYKYLISSSNKCVQGMAGLAFVVADKESLEGLKKNPKRSFYLNLYDHYEYILRKSQMRFTPPVQVFYALNQALNELLEEGVGARFQRYSDCWECVIKNIDKLGLKPLLPIGLHSRICTAILDPDLPGYDFDKMHDFLLTKDITIYPGIGGELNNFRISNLGDLTPADINKVFVYLKEYFDGLEC